MLYYYCAMNSKEVIKILKQNGFEQDRQKGSHKHFRHLDGRKVVVPDHGTKDLKIGTLQNIEKTSGIKMR